MITVQPNHERWRRDVRATFARFEKRLAGGVDRNVTFVTASEAPEVVRTGLVRPEGQRGHLGLGAVIQQSIRPAKGAIGTIVGDRKVLDQLAPYWAAIEYGSTHLVGKTVAGFVGPQGLFAPSRSRERFESDGLSRREAKAAGLKNRMAVVEEPITEHEYLETLSRRAQARFSAEVDARAKEAFSKIPYKRAIAAP